ncbi:uncharacterized protein LOC131674120 [Phymastichus coffea]|uniref:uncharacterized protein LOC131674120 n=1 Tax=Phymastichus coffea TaxID=108790 RepID=UPI00273C7759|nr:uncharacterized protein LOC131674120 [Phymastichus coffea]
MTKLMGILLGVSFQTELLIMTLLGLANSTLDWKPFELIPRLNLIKELNFSDENAQFTNTFSERIRNLLTVTVVVEFFCGLLNPLTHLLKLYPIITWSRSILLLPWLLTHALNTILPKILSVTLVFVFYKANKISTLSLLEFVVVESINLSIASYNWYVFFEFYLNLREVERHRVLQSASDEKIIEGPGSLSQTYSSIPDLQEIFRETFTGSDEFRAIRSARSLTYMIENDSRESDDISSPTLSFAENLSPAERSMRMLNLTPDDLEDAKKDKQYVVGAKHSDSSIKTYKATCSCSSSDDDDDDDDDATFFLSRKWQSKRDPPNSGGNVLIESQPSVEVHSRTRANYEPSGALTQSKQIAASLKPNSLDTMFDGQFTSLVLSRSRSNAHGLNGNLYFLLSKNIELVDQMCRAISNKNKTASKDNMEKWLIFQRQLECNLQRHVLSKESSASSRRKPSSASESSGMANQALRNKIRNGAIKFKQDFEPAKNLNDSKLASYSAFNKILSRKTRAGHADATQCATSRKPNALVLKSIKSLDTDASEIPELWNLKIYNDLTLEEDRREMAEKKIKKSKMVRYEAKNQAEDVRCDVVNNEQCRSANYSSDCLKLSIRKQANAERPKMYRLSQCRANVKELIKQINWNINMRAFERLSPTKVKVPQRAKKVSAREDSERIDTFEDETLSELQNAFSHSDDNARGFQLGPETNQPYPIFEIVAMTLTEILKANGWPRNPAALETEREGFPMSEDAIFCDSDVEPVGPAPDSDDKWDEIEWRKARSASLVRQLEDQLHASREALLSGIEAPASTSARAARPPRDAARRRYRARLQSAGIARTIADWAVEGLDGADPVEWASNWKRAADNGEMEEFPAM